MPRLATSSSAYLTFKLIRIHGAPTLCDVLFVCRFQLGNQLLAPFVLVLLLAYRTPCEVTAPFGYACSKSAAVGEALVYCHLYQRFNALAPLGCCLFKAPV